MAFATVGAREPLQHVLPDDCATQCAVARLACVERHCEPSPFGDRGLVRLAFVDEKAAVGECANLRSAEATEQFDALLKIRIADRFGADQNELRRMRGMPGGIGHGYHAAERNAEHDRMDDAERVAERPPVVTPLRQRPGLFRAGIAAAVAAMVEINDLCDVGEGRIGRLVERMIESWPAVQEQQRRLLAHRRAIGDELGALDIEEQAYAIDLNVHDLFSPARRMALSGMVRRSDGAAKGGWLLAEARSGRAPGY